METTESDTASGPKARVWNEFQKAIFENVAAGNGHLAVIARAGCGKTTVIVESFTHVPKGKSVLMVAFNKSIQEELSERAPAGVRVLTLHSFGFRSMRRKAPTIEKEKVRRLIDAQLQGFDLRKRPDLREVQMLMTKVVSLAKGSLAETEEQILTMMEEQGVFLAECDSSVFVKYVLNTLELCKQDTRNIDFDDMVWLPVVLNLPVDQYDVVFVDETQDLNACQVELALMACKKGGRIIAVGDPMQSVYGFRGADRSAVPNLIKRLDANTLPLSVTYRCGKRIVAHVKHLVPDLEAAPTNQDGLVEKITYDRMVSMATPLDFILSRSNAPLVRLCMQFFKEGRRATVQGRDIGASLLTIIKKARAQTVPDLVTWVDRWKASEIQKILARDEDADVSMIVDRADCILTIAQDALSIQEVTDNAERLFSDEKNGGTPRLILSSTHKAKGLERERVFLLSWTFNKLNAQARPAQVQEEKNLYYVACTRAKNHLILVSKPVQNQV